MNFLTLCQTLARECGASSASLTTVTGVTGENARFVEWIRQSNKDIQGLWANWKFNHATFTATTTTGQSSVTAPSDIEYWDRSRFQLDGYDVECVDYSQWKNVNESGNQKPSLVVIMPDNSLKLVNTPDDAYTLTGDYYKAPQELTANSDVPRIPSQFHDLIYLHAMLNYAYFEAADDVLLRSREKMAERLPRLEANQLPGNERVFQSNGGFVVEVV